MSKSSSHGLFLHLWDSNCVIVMDYLFFSPVSLFFASSTSVIPGSASFQWEKILFPYFLIWTVVGCQSHCAAFNPHISEKFFPFFFFAAGFFGKQPDVVLIYRECSGFWGMSGAFYSKARDICREFSLHSRYRLQRKRPLWKRTRKISNSITGRVTLLFCQWFF